MSTIADQQLGNQLGVNSTHTASSTQRSNMGGAAASSDPQIGQDIDTTDNISAMRTRLAAIAATYYTAARLNNMTYNDCVYAIRVADAASTVK